MQLFLFCNPIVDGVFPRSIKEVTMARLEKTGLDYFPLDCIMNDSMELIEAELGIQSFAIIIKLYQKIYSENGYYCNWSDEIALLFARRLCVDTELINRTISSALRRGIFDDERFKSFGVLTSRGIQERYLEATSRRKRVNLRKELLLTDTDGHKNVYIDGINEYINSDNEDISTQSKVKESIVKESIVKDTKAKESRVNSPVVQAQPEENSPNATSPRNRSALHPYGEFKNVFISDEELGELKLKYPCEYLDKIERLSAYMEGNGINYKNHFAKLIEWLKQDKGKGSRSHISTSHTKTYRELMGLPPNSERSLSFDKSQIDAIVIPEDF